ncbi:MAG: hypothetical protein DWQ37_19110 [Planctomycetota bacterium]|nr:MAG: hypothetical protein DWQ37_19110 [Planctomycetota bacterium]
MSQNPRHENVLPPEIVRGAIEQVLRPGCFFVAAPEAFRVESAEETVPWEVFRGHLLDAAMARTSETFESWHVYVDSVAPAGTPPPAPLVSIRWSQPSELLYVTRQILTYGFEAYEDPPGVILTRPIQKWTSELVGQIDLAETTQTSLVDELGQLLLLAVIGTSRLPITSLETPLPAFSLGRLAYQPGLSADRPYDDALDFLNASLASRGPVVAEAKVLESALRVEGSEVADLADALVTAAARHEPGWLVDLVRAVFNGVALAPYTNFGDRFVKLVEHLATRDAFGPARAVDALGYMLRHLCRHLTAFDLTVFHNFGANYPDALFLDVLLKALLDLGEQQPALLLDAGASARRGRRALRQAALVRRHYEGHRVPDAPTSTGENTRVLPAPFVRVPEEQIRETSRRRRTLFADDPTDTLLSGPTREAIELGLAELDQPGELRELGMAQFLDRPLGALKEAGEVDRTPLVSYEACSRMIIRRRLQELTTFGWIDSSRRDALTESLAAFEMRGVPAAEIATQQRPGVVSLTDAGQAAPDFVLLRTTRGSLDAVLAAYDWQALADTAPDVYRCLREERDVLLVPHALPDDSDVSCLRLIVGGVLRLELGFPSRGPRAPYRELAGVEWLTRLELRRVWNLSGDGAVTQRELRGRDLSISLLRDR